MIGSSPTGVRIEICGGIASGKTTLAHALVTSTAQHLVLEDFHANPFWSRFHELPDLFALEKNVCFLAQHTGEIKAAGDHALVICDYGVFQDLAYARLQQASDHLRVMKMLYEHLYRPLPPPSLVVQLRCEPDVQLHRIRTRARREEASISLDYLRRLNEAIDEALAESLPGTRVHIIRADEVDFAHDPRTAAAVREGIFSIVAEHSGR